VADPADQLNRVTVVNDQFGRLTFTTDMAEAIFHLLDSHAPYGTYNLTGSGAVKSWAEIAATVFEQTNGNGDKVKPISTDEYFANAKSPVSPRPTHSALDLSKIGKAGYMPADWEKTLKSYVSNELNKESK
ncbi:sugar nucleotide-binding protein, partial [Bifidobacterium vansinderenii]